MEKKEKDKKNIIIGVLVFIIVLLGGFSVYTFFIKKNDNVIDNKYDAIYKTRDAKYVLKANENAVYLNDKKIIVRDKNEDEKYLQYFGDFENKDTLAGLTILVDKEKKQIIENKANYIGKEDIDEFGDYAIFSNRSSLAFVKTNAGYFFVISLEGPYDEIYTTNWTKLGFIDSIYNIKSDIEGIYVYSDYDNKLINEMKYDVYGNKLNSDSSNFKGLKGGVYKSDDNKYKLTIIDRNNTTEHNKAENEFKTGFEKYHGKNKYVNRTVLNYGYLDGKVIEINEVLKEDDSYISFIGEYLPSVINGMCGSNIHVMLNKKENTIEIPPVGAEDKFYLCVHKVSFMKLNNNYVFLFYYMDDPKNVATVYTAKWKKIGYINRMDIKYDKEGIYVYDNDNLTGDTIKYDFNGNK